MLQGRAVKGTIFGGHKGAHTFPWRASLPQAQRDSRQKGTGTNSFLACPSDAQLMWAWEAN